jgi:hypothetical protein
VERAKGAVHRLDKLGAGAVNLAVFVDVGVSGQILDALETPFAMTVADPVSREAGLQCYSNLSFVLLTLGLCLLSAYLAAHKGCDKGDLQ